MLNLRAEKTTRNADDFRVLLAGCVLTILFMLIGPMISQKWDEYGARRPFVQAVTMELIDTPSSTFPVFVYDADATHTPMHAIWVVTVYGNDGHRLFTRRGEGDYNAYPDNAKQWSWYAFFDNEIGLLAPVFPKEPFKACVRYIAITESGVKDESPEYCIKVYTPKKES